MAFLGAALPIAVSVLGAMVSKDKQQPEGPQGQPAAPPPGMGELFAMNEAAYANRDKPDYMMPWMGGRGY